MIAAVLLLVGERPADEDQQDEVDGADAGRVQVAELLADLAVDLQAGHGRPDETELEERALRRDVGAGARGQRPAVSVVPPTRIAFGPADDGRGALQAGARAGR